MMTMVMKEISASRFKAECLALLDRVAVSGEELVVTKRGRAVARVVPVEPPAPLRGSVTYLADDDDLWAPLGDAWDAERP
jgi:prevent-host-death family protein